MYRPTVSRELRQLVAVGVVKLHFNPIIFLATHSVPENIASRSILPYSRVSHFTTNNSLRNLEPHTRIGGDLSLNPICSSE